MAQSERDLLALIERALAVPAGHVAVPVDEMERWLGWLNTQAAEPDHFHWEGSALECMEEVAAGIRALLPERGDE